MLKLLLRVDRALVVATKGLLLIMVAAIVALPLLQIVLRVASGGGLPWAHEVVRTLMLWIAFLGASLATAERRHITIDLTDRHLSPRAKAGFNAAVQTVALLLVAYLCWMGWLYIGTQREFGDASAILRIPVWQAQVVIPAALALIGWHLLVRIAEDLRGLATGDCAYLAGPDREGRLY